MNFMHVIHFIQNVDIFYWAGEWAKLDISDLFGTVIKGQFEAGPINKKTDRLFLA